MFSDQDLKQIQNKGIDIQTLDEQIRRFKEGFPYIKIVKAATLNDGIQLFDEQKIKKLQELYENEQVEKQILKFVPASGAASRMFKNLYKLLDQTTNDEEAYQEISSNDKYEAVFTFFKNIEKFAFFDDLKRKMDEKGLHLEEAILKQKYRTVLDTLLNETGLNYGNLPKGLLKFHRYENGSRTPVEEHLVEGANYSRSKNNKVYIHFTVPPEQKDDFIKHVNDVKPAYEKQFNVTYDISYSVQKPSTDTIAVDMSNEPFKNEDGSLLFRPGGHGALLENLDEFDYDMIFIKNIDNVVPDHVKGDTYYYKKMLGGILFDYQNQIFSYQRALEDVQNADEQLIEKAYQFVTNDLCVLPPEDIHDRQQKINFIVKKLNRPVRVCGMVKNEGEPGGGPYWAENADGSVSLQIIESSQVNMDDTHQKEVFNNASHFNPVDIVCSVKDYKGNKFNLLEFRDPETGFISKKSKDGKELKALELPGLWNGSMSDWNTIFVEVPVSTFNPVKTVNDLLRENHQ